MQKQVQKKVIPDAIELFVTFVCNEEKFLIVDCQNTISDVFWKMDEACDPTEVSFIEVCSSDSFTENTINLSEVNLRLQTVNWRKAITDE